MGTIIISCCRSATLEQWLKGILIYLNISHGFYGSEQRWGCREIPGRFEGGARSHLKGLKVGVGCLLRLELRLSARTIIYGLSVWPGIPHDMVTGLQSLVSSRERERETDTGGASQLG